MPPMPPLLLFSLGLGVGFGLGCIFMAVFTSSRRYDPPCWRCGLRWEEHPPVDKGWPPFRRCLPPAPPPPAPADALARSIRPPRPPAQAEPAEPGRRMRGW
jgi:hypothetical protein